MIKTMLDIKRIFTLLFLTAFLTMTVTDAHALTPAQKKEVISKINASAAAIKSMSCSFTQTKNLKMLSDKMVSTGKLYYSKPNRLRWEYTSPYRYMFILNGSKVFTGSISRKNIIDANTNKVYREVSRIMMSAITGQALSNTSDFTADIEGTKSEWTVTLMPKKKELKHVFKQLRLVFNKKTSMISAIKIYEKNGDFTDITLSHISTDKPINESVFAIP